MKGFLFKAWTFIALSLWALSLILFTVAREFKTLNLSVMAGAIALTIVLLLIKRKSILHSMKKPFFLKSLNSAFRVAIVFCILCMLNYLSVKTSKNFDFTSAKIHTLSEQSREIAAQVKSNLKISLYAKRVDWERHLRLLRQYENENKRITLEAIDVEENPSLAKVNQVEENGTILLESEGKKIKGVASSELAITNLILKIIRNKKPLIYYTYGHGELERQNSENSGGSYLFGILNSGAYELRELDLLNVRKVPADADALLMLGPRNGILDSEAQVLKEFFRRGGNAFVLIGPNFNGAHYQNLVELLDSRGINYLNSLTLDRLSAVQGANATIPIVNKYNEEHSATKKFEGRTLFPLSAALLPSKNAGGGITYTALAQSSPFPASWAESQFKDLNSGKVYFNKGLDVKGPVGLLAVTEDQKNFGRLAVASSIEFLSNSYQNQSSNFNLFMNALAWVMNDEGVISLNRPSLSSNMIILSAGQISLIFYFSILFLPFLFFGIGIYVYRRVLHK